VYLDIVAVPWSVYLRVSGLKWVDNLLSKVNHGLRGQWTEMDREFAE